MHLMMRLISVYDSSFTQKAHGIYTRVLEGANVGVMRSKMVGETGEPGGNADIGRAANILKMPRPGFETRCLHV